MKDLVTFKRMIYRLLYILSKKRRWQMLCVSMIILLGAIFELLGVSAILPFIQSIMNPEELLEIPYMRYVYNLFHISDPHLVAIIVGIGIITIYIIKNLYLILSSYVQTSYAATVEKEVSVNLLKSFMNRPYLFFVDHGTGEIMRGVRSDAGGVCIAISNVFSLLTEIFVIILIALYLIKTDWILASSIILIGLVCLLLVVFLMKKKISQMSALSRIADEERYKWIIQIVGGIKDIFVYGRKQYFMQGYEKAHADACKAMSQFSFTSCIPERVIESFSILGIIAAILFRLQLGVSPETFIPNMAVFALGAFRLLPSISKFTRFINIFVFYRAHIDSAFETLVGFEDTSRELKEHPYLEESKYTTNILSSFQSDIQIRNISWRYDEDGQDVLNCLSMRINKGDSIGIIGESGSGKSTLVDILLRLIKPQEGEILMDSINIEKIPQVWSKTIGYVPQTVFLIDGTIRDNVIFGADDPDENKIWNALDKAVIGNHIRNLPEQLDTLVGERGLKLSGGQRQRIAIARALYDEPQILILDEATSALDNETEEAVMDTIESLAGAITLIIIAHRKTTLKKCNKIYEIIDGKALERDRVSL